jgi:hypothetical protein
MNKVVIFILISNIFLINLFGDETDRLVKKLEKIQAIKVKYALENELKNSNNTPNTEMQKLKDKENKMRIQTNISRMRTDIAKNSSSSIKSIVEYVLASVGKPKHTTYNLDIISKIQSGYKTIIVVNDAKYNSLMKEAISQEEENIKIEIKREQVKKLQNIKDSAYVKMQLQKLQNMNNIIKSNNQNQKMDEEKIKEILFEDDKKEISSRISLVIDNNILKIEVK